MTTPSTIATTQEVANRFYELTLQNRWAEIVDELYAPDALSIEPAGKWLPDAEGIPAIKQKAAAFHDQIEEMHGGWNSAPVVGGTHFSMAMGMEITLKGNPDRMKLDEVAVYEVKDGKIVKEQFFF